jgi:hypothetical protein
MSKKVETEKVQTKDKVAIIGTAQTMKDAPFHDDSFDIWAVGTAMTHGKQLVPKVDLIFELHTKDRWEMRTRFYNERGVTVMMQQHDPDVPLSVAFPKDEILKKYRPYFTNSISWMTAYAIEQGYKEIHFYGVHMATVSEYAYEMPSCEYFIGVAEGKGVKCYVPPGADMVKANRLYGYENPSEFEQRLKFHKKDMQQKLAQANQQYQQAKTAFEQYQAAVESFKLVDSWLER